ncbi:alkaline phosphatase family protein [Paenibacillus sp. J5C_2022]|uniref:alkaline phosphatase family protein n=1 Tax=Paenibacillus sp. J5C2022 TaxID=2977129 RepID=UPI0021D3A673|nr:alkaline phosphatase family protein [Paenibacillus sp. J5C2022]MCU6708628.1 alkaline phosphatase family protein [Paenibacillus sp. J5C2022]
MSAIKKRIIHIMLMLSIVMGSIGGPAVIHAEAGSYDKVIHITWDGFYSELYSLAKQNLIPTPHLDQLVNTGMLLSNHHTTLPSVESARYSAMTGAYPMTTGNTYKYFDGSSVLGLNSTVNNAQTLTESIQNVRTALVINEQSVAQEQADSYTYISTPNQFEATVAEAVYQLSNYGQPDYINLYSNDLYMLNRSSVVSDKEVYMQDLLHIVEGLDIQLGKLMDAVNQYGAPGQTTYVLSSHSGVALTEAKKQSTLYAVLNDAGYTVKEVSGGDASGDHALVSIKNYEAKYMQLRFNQLLPEQVGGLVALIESQPYVKDVLERHELDAMGVHPLFADLLVVPEDGYGFNPASVGVSRPDSLESSAQKMFGVIAGPKVTELDKVGVVAGETSIVDLAPTIAYLLNVPAPLHTQGNNLMLSEVSNNYVLYVNWDGFSYHWYELANADGHQGTPNLNALMQEGVLFTHARTGIPSITGPMQQAIVSGAWPVDTGNSYRYFDEEKNAVIQYGRDNQLENIAEAAVKRGIRLAAVNAWYFQERGAFAGNEQQPYIEGGGVSGFTERVDEMIKVIMGESFVSGGKTMTMPDVPRFLAIYGDDIDSVGHNEHDTRDDEVVSPSIPEHNDAMARTVSRMDADLGRLVQALKDRGIYDKTTIFLTTDHGMIMYGADSADAQEPVPPATSSLPDLLGTIAEIGTETRGSQFKVESLYKEGEGAQPDTEIVVTSVGLQAQIKYLIPLENEVKQRIIEEVQKKEYYGTHLLKEELMRRGAPAHFADVLISPKAPYNFKTGDPSQVRTVRGQHDSLDERAQRVFTMISGEAVNNGIIYDQPVSIIDVAPTMARVLGFEGPSGATGRVLDDVLIEKYKGPNLTVHYPADNGIVSEGSITVQGQTEPKAMIKVNDQLLGTADASGHFAVPFTLMHGLNRVIVEVESGGKETREVLFVTFLEPRQELETAIAEAKQLHLEAVEGTEDGQYTPGSKAVFREAISQAVLVAENNQSTRDMLDAAGVALQEALLVFEKGRSMPAVHAFGEIVLNGADKESVSVTIRSSDGSVEHTADYGAGWGSTALGRFELTDATDDYGNVLPDRLSYYFDLGPGSYTLSVSAPSSEGTWTSSFQVAINSTVSGQLPWGKYALQQLKDAELLPSYEGGAEFLLMDGALSREGGIAASVTVQPHSGAAMLQEGTEVVVFQLLNGDVPAGIIAMEKDIRTAERLTAHFNAVGAGYRVKVYVVDSYGNSLMDVGNNLADPIVLQ